MQYLALKSESAILHVKHKWPLIGSHKGLCSLQDISFFCVVLHISMILIVIARRLKF